MNCTGTSVDSLKQCCGSHRKNAGADPGKNLNADADPDPNADADPDADSCPYCSMATQVMV